MTFLSPLSIAKSCFHCEMRGKLVDNSRSVCVYTHLFSLSLSSVASSVLPFLARVVVGEKRESDCSSQREKEKAKDSLAQNTNESTPIHNAIAAAGRRETIRIKIKAVLVSYTFFPEKNACRHGSAINRKTKGKRRKISFLSFLLNERASERERENEIDLL